MKTKIFALGLLLFLVSGCKNEVATPTNQIVLSGYEFSPNSLTVPVGTTITWVNNDAATHTVTSNNSVFSSGDLLQNKSFSFKFTTAGSFPYHCIYHSGMTGTIVVQ
jgi:plastocyanin